MVVTTRSANGVVGIINHSWSIGEPGGRPWVRVSGTEANIRFEMGNPWLEIEYGGSKETIRFDPDHRGIASMVLEFRRSIVEASEPAMTGEEGLQDLKIVLKAYESAQTGLPVELD